jgi:hypothetical protein
VTCRYCGTELPETAMFCGECGRSLAVSTARPPVALPPAQVSAQPTARIESESEPAPDPDPEPAPEPAPEQAPDPDPELAPEPAPEQVPTPLVVEERAAVESVVPLVVPTEGDRAQQPAKASGRSAPLDDEDTRIVARNSSATRFVLQFSTGESHTVSGTGLIGRNPHAEPGEFFDHRIVVIDNGKSVSKTHLEFGQTAGVMWISDRFSGNGTVIRRPQADPQRGEPGKRYLVSRGSRVDIGDQFFIVS